MSEEVISYVKTVVVTTANLNEVADEIGVSPASLEKALVDATNQGTSLTVGFELVPPRKEN